MAKIFKRKHLGEVFTPIALVNEILDKLSEGLWIDSSRTFLDNSCGNGNFLIEVLKRKLEHGHDARRALPTIYGVDIMKDNVAKCKLRLYRIVKPLLNRQDRKKVQDILNKNIVCADALKYDYSFK